ncbi:MAG: ChaN family lipoprotein [Sulfitobacter sp.]
MCLGVVAAVFCASQPHAQDLTAAQRAEMLAADIVLLGEQHDNPDHHLGQARLMTEIEPAAVVFEMLTHQMAAIVRAFEGDDLGKLGEAIGWEAAGWPSFEIYRPVFAALDSAFVVGAAAPRETVRAAFSEGAAAVFGSDAARYGLTRPLPEAEYQTRETLQFDAHCQAMPLEMMGGMIEAQRLRDAQFAQAALEALAEHGGPVVVITGNGHARTDWGVPFVIAQAASEVKVFSVGFGEHSGGNSDGRFDGFVLTAPIERGDPCAAFGN